MYLINIYNSTAIQYKHPQTVMPNKLFFSAFTTVGPSHRPVATQAPAAAHLLLLLLLRESDPLSAGSAGAAAS
jgi:hypothetical protein